MKEYMPPKGAGCVKHLGKQISILSCYTHDIDEWVHPGKNCLRRRA
jgi:hypothetical protein